MILPGRGSPRPERDRMRFRSFAPAAPLALLALSLCAGAASAAAPSGPTKMLTQPALSADRVAFVYGNDLWTSRLDGSGVQRITSGPGTKTSPAFSPDGVAPRVQRRAGRQPRRLRRPRDRRRAEAPDVAPGARHRPGLHAGRQGRPLLLAARGVQQPPRRSSTRCRWREASRRSSRSRTRPGPSSRPTGRRSPTPRTARGTSSGSATAAGRSRGSGSTTSRRTPS